MKVLYRAFFPPPTNLIKCIAFSPKYFYISRQRLLLEENCSSAIKLLQMETLLLFTDFRLKQS